VHPLKKTLYSQKGASLGGEKSSPVPRRKQSAPAPKWKKNSEFYGGGIKGEGKEEVKELMIYMGKSFWAEKKRKLL